MPRAGAHLGAVLTSRAMSYVAINVLTVPDGAGAVLEERFAARQGSVDSAPGFEHFELLRPLEGTQDYLVYTRWTTEADFTAWRTSQSFGQGHAQASGRPEGAPTGRDRVDDLGVRGGAAVLRGQRRAPERAARGRRRHHQHRPGSAAVPGPGRGHPRGAGCPAA